ncbi:MAG: tetratricopeptide repeat protein [Clostridiales bacterium]|nr:tetratricopeptide repeat protein [Clostridiales bacterium]
MICTKCGGEVEVGEVFCTKCGTAVQIVPDYNPLEDDNIPFDEKETYIERPNTEEVLKKEKNLKKMILRRYGLIAVIILSVCGVGACIYFFVQYKTVNSYDYQFNQGLTYYENEEYEEAIQSYVKAISFNKKDIKARESAYATYLKLEDYDRAIEQILEIVYLDPSPNNYKKLAEVYALNGNTDEINELLGEFEGSKIGEALDFYKINDILVSLPGGRYHDYLNLTLESEEDVKIYYTLNNSEPTIESSVYAGEIIIEEVGKTVLRAIAINNFNIASKEIKETYEITLVVPDAPPVTPNSGKYTEVDKITIEVPEGATAYFTLDGTIPVKGSSNSYIYLEAIEMPIGNVVFSAKIIDKYGTESYVTKKNYELVLDRPYSYNAAVVLLKNKLVELEIMDDMNGNRPNNEKLSLQYSALPIIEDKECYLFFLRITSGNQTTNLNRVFAVSTADGTIYEVSSSEDSYKIVGTP